jgi:hypothetical protein
MFTKLDNAELSAIKGGNPGFVILTGLGVAFILGLCFFKIAATYQASDVRIKNFHIGFS